MDIDEMQAGPEMDARVAEGVMETCLHTWEPLSDEKPWLLKCKKCHVVQGEIGAAMISGSHPKPYSTSIAAAWEVVEKLKNSNQDSACCDFNLLYSTHEGSGPKGDETAFMVPPNMVWFCQFGDVENYAENKGWGGCAHGDTAPLAICRAALKAMKGK